MLSAKDIMKRNVISVRPEMSVDELGRLFIEHDITCVPVTGEDGRLTGIVSEYDLISQNTKVHIPSVLRLFDAIIPLQRFDAIEREIKKISASRVSEICTTDVITVEEDATLEDIATLLIDKHLSLLPVLKDGRILGVVGKHEVLKGIARESSEE